MKISTLIFVGLLAMSGMSPANAASKGGTEWLLDELRDPDDANIGGSKAYMLTIGLANGLRAYDRLIPKSQKPFCVPSFFHNEHLMGAVQVYVSKHSEALEWDYHKTIGEALKELYPCN